MSPRALPIASVLLLGVLLATSLCSVTASAAGAAGARHGRYPMPAAEYQPKLDERVLRARERLETRIVRRKLTPERAREARGKFETHVAEVRKLWTDAAADGVITREEARRVYQSTRSLARLARTAARAR